MVVHSVGKRKKIVALGFECDFEINHWRLSGLLFLLSKQTSAVRLPSNPRENKQKPE